MLLSWWKSQPRVRDSNRQKESENPKYQERKAKHVVKYWYDTVSNAIH